MEPTKLMAISKELSKDEIDVILALSDEPYELEIIASEVRLPTQRVEEILIKFEQRGFIRKR